MRFLLALLLAAEPGVTVTGHVVERYYTGECRPGAVSEFRVPVGRRMVVRPGDHNSHTPPVAEAVIDASGTFQLKFVGRGPFCLVPENWGPAAQCMETLQGSSEGSYQFGNMFVGTANEPSRCPLADPKRVRGELVFQQDPCGDEGTPPKPIWASVEIEALELAAPGMGYPKAGVVDRDGRFFELRLPPGRYCFRAPKEGVNGGALPKECVDRCDAEVRVPLEGEVPFVRVIHHRTCGDACLATSWPKTEATARGVGRIAISGGTHHVRGAVYQPPVQHCGGAYLPPSPPFPEIGHIVYVRAGDKNEGDDPPAGQVMTDGLGFDVALPPGTWCFAWRPPGKPGPADPLVDPCAYVARIESSTKDLGAALMLPQLPTTPCPLGIP